MRRAFSLLFLLTLAAGVCGQKKYVPLVADMAHDGESLYLTTQEGLVVMDRQTLRPTAVYGKGDVLMDTPSCVALSGDTLWVGQYGRWITWVCGGSTHSFQMDDSDGYFYTPPQKICPGPRSELFVAVLDHLYRVDDCIVTEGYEIPSAFREEMITDMAIDAAGTLWISSTGGVKESALCRYTEEGGLEFVANDFDGFEALEADGSGGIWLASEFCVARVDATGFPVVLNTLPSPIKDIKLGVQGVLWVLCRDGVLKAYDGDACTDYTFPLADDEQFLRMDADDSSVYISTNKRLLVFRDGQFATVDMAPQPDGIEELQARRGGEPPKRTYNLAGQSVGSAYKGVKIIVSSSTGKVFRGSRGQEH